MAYRRERGFISATVYKYIDEHKKEFMAEARRV